MKRKILLLTYLLLPALAAAAGDTAFVNVNVITMTAERPLAGQTVLVRDGRIAAIGPVRDTTVPEGVHIVDGTDRYLMPGLAEMHGHVPGTDSDNLERILTLYVVNGVTSVRSMLGQPSHLGLRADLESGGVFGPRLYTSGPSFNGNSVDSPRQAADMVVRQKAAGYDFLKIHPGLTRAEFRAMAEAAMSEGIRFAGHVPADVGVPLALESGMSTIDHLDGYLQELVPADRDPSGGYEGLFGLYLAAAADAGRIDELARATRAAGTWNVPTQTLFEQLVNAVPPETLADRPEMRYFPADTVARWVERKREQLADPAYDAGLAERAITLRRELLAALHAAGAGLLLGSDAPQVFNVPGFSIHRELELMVAAGLSPYAALESGTVNAARWFGRDERLGTVAVGHEADLVMLDDNPLEDVANSQRIHGVMLRGHWLDREAIDALLARYER